ncbi:MAG: hypothetical protein ACK59A_13735 [Cyanobacteriota bacterium]|jgi:hypothetical protein
MPNYTLNISFDSKGLQAITQAGQVVTIVKLTSSTSKPVAWISFQPQQENQIIWTEQYAVYASTTNLQSGAKIITSATANAVGGSSYNINSAGYFDARVQGATDVNSYEIINGDQNLMVNGNEMVAAGLLQAATVNGFQLSAPMCASYILYNQSGIFTPIETIQVFTSSYSNNGMVISSVSGNALTVTYTTNTSANITYNDQSNTFINA